MQRMCKAYLFASCDFTHAAVYTGMQAVAEAYAVAFVSATAECNELCHTEQADLSAAIGSVLVTASAKVYKYHCTGAATKIAISAIQYQPHGKPCPVAVAGVADIDIHSEKYRLR